MEIRHFIVVLFKFNPLVSFFANFDPSWEENAQKKLDAMWEKLSEGGTALMPLDRYPLGEALRRARGRAVRLAEGQVWGIVANRTQGNG